MSLVKACSRATRSHNPPMHEFDVIIIGAGAAGLMCAATASRRGRRVALLDHAEKPGKKILISGGGRCNFTNLHLSADDYISANPHFCKSALARFSQYDFIDMVETHGIRYHERDHGQLFCDESAGDIVDMLLSECNDVQLTMNCAIHSIGRSPENAGFTLKTNRGNYRCSSLVIATGGLSIPKMGASGFGHKIAGQFGLGMRPTYAGLVPFTLTGGENSQFRQLAGIAIDVNVACNGHAFREAMLFTHRGLSGPAMLQISSYWQPGDTLAVDLLPNTDIAAFLTEQRQLKPQAQLATTLAGLLPKRLVQLLIDTNHIANRRLIELSDKQLVVISQSLSDWRIRPGATEGYRTAEATVGGVDTDELSSRTMEAKKVPGLYFIGEVMDVTGHLGGFNFQWAWSSGYAAGLHA